MTSLGSEAEGEQPPPKPSLPSAAYRPGPVTLGVAIYGLLYLVWERAGWGSDTLRNVVSNVAFMPLNLTVAALLGRASRNHTLAEGTRQTLALLALGSVFVFCGNVVSTYYVIALNDNPQVSWADAFYLSDSLLILAALAAVPISRRTRLERWKFALDAAVVLIAGGVAIWYFSVRPTIAAGIGSLGATLVASAYPLVSLLVILGITTVMLRGPLDPNRRALNLILGGPAAERRGRPDVRPRAARGRRPERQPDRRRLPPVLPAAGGRRRAVSPVPAPVHRVGGRVPAPGAAAERAALPGGGRHLRAAALHRAPGVDRSDQRRGHRRGVRHRAAWWSASSSRSGRTCGCSPRRRCGRTRRASARWCSTRPTSSSWSGPTAASGS